MHIAIAFIGSIPKFHLVRCLEMSREDNPVTDCGIMYGLKRYQQDSEIILQGGNKTVENIINSFRTPELASRVRLEAYRVLSRCLLYLSEKFLTLESPLTLAIRGEKSITLAVEELPSSKICCSPSSLDQKAYLYLCQFTGEERKIVKDSLIETLHDMRDKFLDKIGMCPS